MMPAPISLMTYVMLSAYALLVVGTPLIVTRVVAASAGQRPAAGRRLAVATAMGYAALSAWALIGSPLQTSPLAWHAVETGLFVALAAGFGWPALQQIERAARAAARTAAIAAGPDRVRTADLRPRRVSDVLPTAAQAVPFVLAAAGMAANTSTVLWNRSGDYRPWFALTFTGCALVFLALYAIWMRQEMLAPRLAGVPDTHDAHDRAARVRRIYAVQLTMVVALMTVGAVFARLDWSGVQARGVVMCAGLTGALIGILGSAYALSSGVGARALQWEIADE